jgi:large subunit ribosomal protein L3
MAGQLGNSQVTIRKLEVIRVDGDRNLLLIKGAVPGKPGGLLSVTPAKWVKG